MSSYWAKQPFTFLYIVFLVPVQVVVLVSRILVAGLFRGHRPDPAWSFSKSSAVLFVKEGFLRHLCAVRPSAPLSLKPGSEGDRFDLIPPAESGQITGLADDSEIKPAQIGGTWTPASVKRTQQNQHQDLLVALHFHGGAFVMCEGRDADSGFIARSILDNTRCTNVFAPQYRLSNNPDGRFPAALQDCISAYSYLLNHMGIPSSKIILSGDSAGGNLVIALLRYIAENGSQTGLPWPNSVLLWSPWVDVASALDPRIIETHPNYVTDYLHSSFVNWGAEALTELGTVSAENPYISPIRSPFKIEAPVWVQVSGKEVFYDDIMQFARNMRSVGTEIDVYIEKDAPHDIIMMGQRVGFEKEAMTCAIKAGDFLARVHAGNQL
ncbi:alpha/beta hydrolase [Dactylonectria estremocensis]|uniref:Alpha/beta hydrolase n=1 Tax=Dactylonectria estremocensis TaxID=1079267 RepID=A0A9P9ISN8_9HYPO|nr:alpha/beta hydrolase [Dactylonectria estremocensis]